MKYRAFHLVLFLALYVQSGSSQCDIYGKVTESNTSSTIPFASLSLHQNGVLITGVESNYDGEYCFEGLSPGSYDVKACFVGYKTLLIKNVIYDGVNPVKLPLSFDEVETVLEEICITAYKVPMITRHETTTGSTISALGMRKLPFKSINSIASNTAGIIKKAKNPKTPNTTTPHFSTDSYQHLTENAFLSPKNSPLSNFSIDVDRASYSNIRQMLKRGEEIPADAVRIEEMINYFDYAYEQPSDGSPFTVVPTLTECPWNVDNKLLHIAVQAKKEDLKDLPACNLVFLVDVSGSMQAENKLPLVISSLKLLVNALRPDDKIAVVTYAGHAGVALASTPINQKSKILEVLDGLVAGGSTAGAQGIITAYDLAQQNFIKNGNNRVILATDGDFNVGINSLHDLHKLIEEKRESGIYLTSLGFGYGNYKDDKLQVLAQHGNGNHAYIDDVNEAHKVLVQEIGGTLVAVAKDVKIQIEFNPECVHAYRLIGYESRLLNAEDFNNDKKDAGEIGVGHSVTALYEIVINHRQKDNKLFLDPLKYSSYVSNENKNELATLKYRFKYPDEQKSIKVERTVQNTYSRLQDIPEDIQFSIAVAEFGLLLSDSEYKGKSCRESILERLEGLVLSDKFKQEFIELVTLY